jgi:hypothetical protein
MIPNFTWILFCWLSFRSLSFSSSCSLSGFDHRWFQLRWPTGEQIDNEHDDENDNDLRENGTIILPLTPVGASLLVRAGFSDPVIFRVSVVRRSARLGV